MTSLEAFAAVRGKLDAGIPREQALLGGELRIARTGESFGKNLSPSQAFDG